MTWQTPQVLYLLWLVVGTAVGMLFVSFWRRNVLAKLGDPELVSRLTASRDVKKRFIKNVLVLAAMAAAIVALAQPRTFSRKIQVVREGVDLVIAVDVSLSMLADDIHPSRWEAARAGIDQIIQSAPVDRVGLIAFSGDSQMFPLTADRRYLRRRLAELDPNTAPIYGTSVGNALQSALGSFIEKERKARILLFVTDGEDHQVGGLHLLNKTRAEGLHVFVVGVGSPDGGTIPLRRKDGSSYLKADSDGQVVHTFLNEKLLQQMAEDTNGKYFAQFQNDKPFAGVILEELQQINRLEAFQDVLVEYDNRFQLPLLISTLLLLLEVSLSERRKLKESVLPARQEPMEKAA